MSDDYTQRVRDAVACDLSRGEDGYWVYWPIGKTGAYTAADLRVIADYLDEKNGR